ncbi:hypothetical protein J2T13_002540 [Paenibacillus sp. DS2015]|uniref:hypothetical protein n=1 Tax=Paenibacillus sp. DS2015 TaxID=3373917 RepID=UPI003D1F247B
MSSYLKLVHMEVNRFKFILLGLMSLTILCQLGAMIFWTANQLSLRKTGVWQNGSSVMFSNLTFADMISSTQLWFIVPILLSIGVLAIYVFLIWYRDWLGQNTFIYRLLMLPTARRHIYLAKGTAILIFVFGLVSFQLALLPVGNFVFNLIVSSDLREPSHFSEIIAANQALAFLIPKNFDQFLVSYGLGIIAVLVIFTAILIERSYRRVGILYAILYLVICLLAILFPLIGLGLNDMNGYLYPNEIFTIELVMCVGVVVMSVWLGFRLLSKKITV